MPCQFIKSDMPLTPSLNSFIFCIIIMFSGFIVSVLIPFCPTLYVLIPAMFIQGIPMGCLDNG